MTGSFLRTIPDGHSSRQTNRKNHDLHFLVGVCFVLIVAKCATLIFVSAVAIDEDVSAEGIFVFLGPESARRQVVRGHVYMQIGSRTASLGPRRPNLAAKIGRWISRRRHGQYDMLRM